MSTVALQRVGRRLGRYLVRRSDRLPEPSASQDGPWWEVIRPGDVLLVETCTRVATAIKYLTQSTWSHAALFVGGRCEAGPLIEAEVSVGVIASPLEKYRGSNTRICRPVALSDADLERVMAFAVSRIGTGYDLRNIFDLARYLLPTPPVPTRWRRRLLTFGSGEPTKAICSSLIAEAFQQIGYPILPMAVWASDDPESRALRYQVRHHGAFTPRDFDLSPYFSVIKPTLQAGFDYRTFDWDGAARRIPGKADGVK